ncbi:YgaP-like transmembrane domain [Ralstonia sp. 1B3]|uniref:YgaP-like transmembrane domain n=1 Tax=Ralstonia sp. 1B3 TaxID=2997421 RepID=UPI002FC5C5F2
MFYLKRNLPTPERLIRASLGLCTAAATATWATTWGMIAGYAAAAILAGTAVVGFCPACALVGRTPIKN